MKFWKFRAGLGKLANQEAAEVIPMVQPLPFHVVRDLRSRQELDAVKNDAPGVFDCSAERAIVEGCLTRGISTDFLGRFDPSQVSVIGPEMREHLHAGGFNSRQRAVFDEIFRYQTSNEIKDNVIRIHGHEAITHFALKLRGRYPKYIGTEYCSSEAQRRELFPIAHADICHLQFHDDSFDLIVSCDVLEHVPDLDAALREAVRTLKPGGRMIVTMPIFHERDTGMRFASLVDGEVVFHTEPIYHGNPMDEHGGALVFEIPGWDLIDRARAAGFADVVARLICDERRGIVASHNDAESTLKGVLVFLFDKAP